MKGKYKWLFLVMLIFGGCKHGLNVKVFQSEPQMGGLYRAQQKELVPYQKSNGFFCLNESDIEALLNFCETKPSGVHEQGPAVKIYQILVSKGGLVRMQNNELILFGNSGDYYCINQSDFEALINSCLNPAGN